MKLYRNSAGEWFGTQADAKADKIEFSAVEVPTDKAGLLDFLNLQGTEYGVPYRPASGNDNCEPTQPAPVAPAAESHADKQVRFEDAFEQFPISKKLHFAALAVEEARLLS